jgi:hypothetical protein
MPRIEEDRFVLCIRNDDYPASLEVRKLYHALPDPEAAEEGLLRVVDESGEDYLYPEQYFVAIELTPSVREALATAA